MTDRPSNPFPGVNPFIEWEGYWRDFHRTLINYVRERLLEKLPGGYDARIEEDALLIDPHSGQWHRYPDVAVVTSPQPRSRGTNGGVSLLAPSVEIEPAPIRADEERHVWIEIRSRGDDSLVTSIEILSPTNKVGSGMAEFRFKRKELFDAGANLVDIDLLLGGTRLPFKQPLPAGDFFAFVSRQDRAPLVQVYAMPLAEPLRPIPIPLRSPDPDVVLDLQSAYTLAFERGGYPRRLRYPTQLPEITSQQLTQARTLGRLPA